MPSVLSSMTSHSWPHAQFVLFLVLNAQLPVRSEAMSSCSALRTNCLSGEYFFLTVDGAPQLNGSKGDISSQDVEQLCRWIHANRDMIKKVWEYEVHAFNAQWIPVA